MPSYPSWHSHLSWTSLACFRVLVLVHSRTIPPPTYYCRLRSHCGRDDRKSRRVPGGSRRVATSWIAPIVGPVRPISHHGPSIPSLHRCSHHHRTMWPPWMVVVPRRVASCNHYYRSYSTYSCYDSLENS